MQAPIEHVFVKPARPGLVMYDPTTRRRLPDDGALVERSTYWRRRLANGDAVEVAQPAPVEIAQPAPAAARAKSKEA